MSHEYRKFRNSEILGRRIFDIHDSKIMNHKNRGMNDQNISITLVTFVIWSIIYFLNDEVVNHAVSRRGKMVSWLIHCLRIMKIDSDRFFSFRNIQVRSWNFEFSYPRMSRLVALRCCFFQLVETFKNFRLSIIKKCFKDDSFKNVRLLGDAT